MNPHTTPPQARLPQTSKSIFDYTEDGLNRIDKFQDENRGFRDEPDEDLENDFNPYEYEN